MRKVRKPNSAFQVPEEAKENMRKTIRKARLEGKEIKMTSAKVHGCNRCVECDGKCPT